MRRFVFVAVLALGLSTAVANASGPKDYAKGAGTTPFGQEFWFNASSDPAGEGPMGTIKITTTALSGEVEIFATVTCLMTIGTSGGGGVAAIGGDITKVVPSDATFTGDGILVNALDRGPNPGADADGFYFEVLPESPPEHGCGLVAALPIEGDITVIDQ